MKQRSSSFQISDILGLPPKENSSGDDAQTTIPPASISSALHSSNNPYVIFTGYSSTPTEPPLSPAPPTDPQHHHLSYSLINQLPAPLEPPPTTINPIHLTPPSPPAAGHHHHPNPPTGSHHLIHSKPSTGGYLPGNLNSSFLESSAAAAAHHYNNLFHGRWHMDNNNSSDHYGEYTLSN